MNINEMTKHSASAWFRFLNAKIGIGRGMSKRTQNKYRAIEAELRTYSTQLIFPYKIERECENLSHEEYEAIIKGADFVIGNRTNILCEGEYVLNTPIPWQCDFVTGLKFPANKDEISNTHSDIKRVWDLSRFHQLMPLCKAYYISKDCKYVEKIEELILSWYGECYEGSNSLWSNPMEIAIRAVNLIHTICFLDRIGKVSDQLRNQINSILVRSAFEIRYNLENETLVVNNHYVSDLLGLLTISAYFVYAENNTIFKKWMRFALKRLIKEAKRQVYSDGVSYEQSTGYHAFVLELFAFSVSLLQCNNYHVSEMLIHTVKEMGSFIADISENGVIPLIGDNDNSKLLHTSHEYPFDKPNDVAMLLKLTNGLVGGLSDKKGIYKDAGYFVLRNGKLKLLFNCGKLSCNGAGGHSHNDQLAFTLWYDRNLIVGDPGTQCYTSNLEKRNQSRSTAYHSTVQVENYEQNSFRRCFEMPEETFSVLDDVAPNQIGGHHLGYQKKCGAVHYRRIMLENDTLSVNDRVEGYSGISFSRIILPPYFVEVAPCQFKHKKINVLLNCEGNPVEVDAINYSESYGRNRKSIRITIPFRQEIKYTISILEEKQ